MDCNIKCVKYELLFNRYSFKKIYCTFIEFFLEGINYLLGIFFKFNNDYLLKNLMINFIIITVLYIVKIKISIVILKCRTMLYEWRQQHVLYISIGGFLNKIVPFS